MTVAPKKRIRARVNLKFRVEQATHRELVFIAARRAVPLADVVREACRAYVADQGEQCRDTTT